MKPRIVIPRHLTGSIAYHNKGQYPLLELKDADCITDVHIGGSHYKVIPCTCGELDYIWNDGSPVAYQLETLDKELMQPKVTVRTTDNIIELVVGRNIPTVVRLTDEEAKQLMDQLFKLTLEKPLDTKDTYYR